MITKKEIAAKSFEIFRFWSSVAKNKYPHHCFAIIDETKLVENLTETIQDARKSLLKEEREEKRYLEGYDEGFTHAFICSNLNTKWYFEYITKQTNGYKQFLAIKALKIYLELDTLAKIRATKIYEHLLNDDNNLLEVSPSIKHEPLKITNMEENENLPNNEILIALNNQIISFIKNNFINQIPDFLSITDGHFSKNEIKDIINDYIEK